MSELPSNKYWNRTKNKSVHVQMDLYGSFMFRFTSELPSNKFKRFLLFLACYTSFWNLKIKVYNCFRFHFLWKKTYIFGEKILLKYSNASSYFYLGKMLYRFIDLAMWHVYLGKWYKVFNCAGHEGSDEIPSRNYEIICKTDSQVSLHSTSRGSYCSPGFLAGRFFGLISGSQIETVLCLQTITYDTWIY